MTWNEKFRVMVLFSSSLCVGIRKADFVVFCDESFLVLIVINRFSCYTWFQSMYSLFFRQCLFILLHTFYVFSQFYLLYGHKDFCAMCGNAIK